MQPPVAIVKASAGSGKTYRLTHDYLDLLLAGDPQRYKHILAVTFTNKATEEMTMRGRRRRPTPCAGCSTTTAASRSAPSTSSSRL